MKIVFIDHFLKNFIVRGSQLKSGKLPMLIVPTNWDDVKIKDFYLNNNGAKFAPADWQGGELTKEAKKAALKEFRSFCKQNCKLVEIKHERKVYKHKSIALHSDHAEFGIDSGPRGENVTETFKVVLRFAGNDFNALTTENPEHPFLLYWQKLSL